MNGLTSFCCLVLTWLAAPTTADPPAGPARYEFTQVVMGASAHLVLYAGSEEKARDAARAAFARLNELDAVMSDYRNDSELVRLCAGKPGQAVRVSEDLASVLAIALEVSEKTDGAFDVTVGPVVGLWREARRSGIAPDPGELGHARTLVGAGLFTLDAEASTVTLERNGMRLDLGGIGKGFAADEAIKTLAGLGIESALVDLGGDIAASNPPPGRDGWTVIIDDGGNDPYPIRIANGAVATSGDLEQHVIINGERFSHIIDPRTGVALTDSAAATVLARSGAVADALASAFCVLGPTDPLRAALARFEGVEASVTNRKEMTSPRHVLTDRIFTTAGMPKAGEFWSP